MPVKKSKLPILIGSEEESSEDNEHYFFPSLIKKEKEKDAYIELNDPCSVLSLECQSQFDVSFIHSLLLNLAFNYTLEEDTDCCFFWKGGLTWCSDDQIEVSVDIYDGNKIVKMCHSVSSEEGANFRFAKYRSKLKIIREIRTIRELHLLPGDSHHVEEYIHYPPQSYYNKECGKISLVSFF